MQNDHIPYAPVIRQRLESFFSSADWNGMTAYLNRLSHKDFRIAGQIIGTVCLPEVEEDAFWSIFSQIFFAGSLIMFAANFIFIGIGIAACIKRKYFHLIPAALLMPLYWLLISLAAWKGFWQIFTKPFYWEKTRHGLTGSPEEGQET